MASTMRASARSSFAGAAVVSRRSSERCASRTTTVAVVAKERPLWLTGSVAPKHLDGTLGARP